MTARKRDLSRYPIAQIKPALENVRIYDDFGIANLDDAELAISIRDEGIKEPLVLSRDHVLLSGHRRLAASKYLGLKSVPVRILEDVIYESLPRAGKLSLLRMHNQQRAKSPGERIRERLVTIDPEAARTTLLMRRMNLQRPPVGSVANVDIGQVTTRARITTIRFLEAVQRVVEENEAYLPLTDRRIHYLLLNDPPLRHDKKPGSKYANDKASYKALTNLLIRARLSGQVPMGAIEDSTRPIQAGGGFSTLEKFIETETQNFLGGYTRNLMQGQLNHIEIILEKNALRSVIEVVARQYNIPMTTVRGYSSLSPRAALCDRFRRSGKPRLVLLMLTDFDPDGEQIASSFARSLRDDFRLRDIHAVKVALTAEDITEYDLPSDMDAKPSSPNYAAFLAKHGSKAVELDAAPVSVLQAKLREAIKRVIDIDEFNAQIELEKDDAAHLEAYRQVVIEAIGGVS